MRKYSLILGSLGIRTINVLDNNCPVIRVCDMDMVIGGAGFFQDFSTRNFAPIINISVVVSDSKLYLDGTLGRSFFDFISFSFFNNEGKMENIYAITRFLCLFRFC